MSITSEALDFYEAIIDVLTVFISTEIGAEVEFNNEVIARYIDSFDCRIHFWDAHTKEDVYKQFTDDILNGYPVWEMMKLPEWTRKMVEESFQAEQADALEKARKKYKCLTCKYYEEKHTQLGVLSKCTHERCCVNTNPIGHSKGVLMQLRRVCKLYDKKGR